MDHAAAGTLGRRALAPLSTSRSGSARGMKLAGCGYTRAVER
jgi:hypothetical protein